MNEVSDPIEIQRLTVSFNIIFHTKIITRAIYVPLQKNRSLQVFNKRLNFPLKQSKTTAYHVTTVVSIAIEKLKDKNGTHIATIPAIKEN